MVEHRHIDPGDLISPAEMIARLEARVETFENELADIRQALLGISIVCRNPQNLNVVTTGIAVMNEGDDE